MPISEQTLAEIRARTDIVELISAHVPLKRAGANFITLCPFHREKTPSFSVSPAKQIFYCFGCHCGGDIFKFVMLRDNLDFPAAARLLAERAGVALQDGRGNADAASRGEKEQLYKLHELVCAFFCLRLEQDPAAKIARDYIARRQLSPESVRLFRLGYAPDAWDATLRWAAERKIPLALLQRAGLIIRRDSGGHYDRFRRRLMFPICDEQGRVVGFSGRVLADDPQTPKYVNSPETPIFQKGRILFGLDKTKRALLDAKLAILCEGQIDLIACYQRGLENVVAPQGTALTADHARILKRYVDEVVLCFDADAAGQNAAARSLDPLLESGLVVRVATLPKGHDPDAFLRQKGVEALQRIVQTAPSYFDWRLEMLCREHNPATDAGKSRIVRALLESVAKVNDAVVRDGALRAAAQRLGVREAALREELTKLALRRGPAAVAAREERPAPKVISTAEQELLHLLLADESGAALRVAQEKLDPALLPQNDCGRWIGKILEWAAAQRWPSAGVAALGDAPEGTLARLAMTPLRCPDPAVAAEATVAALRRAARHEEIARVERALRNPEISEKEREQLMKQLLDLRRGL